MKLGLEQVPPDDGKPDAEAQLPETRISPPGELTAPSPEELAVQLPQLEILELLGQGGMGAVYKARQTNLDRAVAVKIIKPDAADDADTAPTSIRWASCSTRC